jgi:uncharacterized membrane protein YjfL (UPF0719 family)
VIYDPIVSGPSVGDDDGKTTNGAAAVRTWGSMLGLALVLVSSITM